MALEPGGYADKLGNRYEGLWVVRQLFDSHERPWTVRQGATYQTGRIGLQEYLDCEEERVRRQGDVAEAVLSLLIIPSSFAVKDLRHLPYARSFLAVVQTGQRFSQ